MLHPLLTRIKRRMSVRALRQRLSPSARLVLGGPYANDLYTACPRCKAVLLPQVLFCVPDHEHYVNDGCRVPRHGDTSLFMLPWFQVCWHLPIRTNRCSTCTDRGRTDAWAGSTWAWWIMSGSRCRSGRRPSGGGMINLCRWRSSTRGGGGPTKCCNVRVEHSSFDPCKKTHACDNKHFGEG